MCNRLWHLLSLLILITLGRGEGWEKDGSYLHFTLEEHTLVAQAVKNPPAMQERQEMKVWSLGRENPLREEMATHSSILAWRISWTEEPGGLQSTVHGVKKSWTWLKWLRTHPGRKLSCPAWDLSFLVPNPLFLPPLCAFWPTITEALTLQVWNQLDITPGQSISNWGKDS